MFTGEVIYSNSHGYGIIVNKNNINFNDIYYPSEDIIKICHSKDKDLHDSGYNLSNLTLLDILHLNLHKGFFSQEIIEKATSPDFNPSYELIKQGKYILSAIITEISPQFFQINLKNHIFRLITNSKQKYNECLFFVLEKIKNETEPSELVRSILEEQRKNFEETKIETLDLIDEIILNSHLYSFIKEFSSLKRIDKEIYSFKKFVLENDYLGDEYVLFHDNLDRFSNICQKTSVNRLKKLLDKFLPYLKANNLEIPKYNNANIQYQYINELREHLLFNILNDIDDNLSLLVYELDRRDYLLSENDALLISLILHKLDFNSIEKLYDLNRNHLILDYLKEHTDYLDNNFDEHSDFIINLLHYYRPRDIEKFKLNLKAQNYNKLKSDFAVLKKENLNEIDSQLLFGCLYACLLNKKISYDTYNSVINMLPNNNFLKLLSATTKERYQVYSDYDSYEDDIGDDSLPF